MFLSLIILSLSLCLHVNNTVKKHETQITLKLHFMSVFHCPFLFSGGSLALSSDDSLCVSNYLLSHRPSYSHR